jgi:hypothetical protein
MDQHAGRIGALDHTYGAPDRSPAIARLLQRMQQTP